MIIVDVETSGVDHREHGILSIGAIDFENPKRRFYAECRLSQNIKINEDSLLINGFLKEQCYDKNKTDIRETLISFIKWINESDDQTIAGQNVSFDRDFLNAAAKQLGLDWNCGIRTVDLHTLCYLTLKKEQKEIPLQEHKAKLSLDAIAQALGLPEEPKPHHALNGAKWEAECFSRLLFKKNLLDEFKQYPVIDVDPKRIKSKK